MPEYTGRPVYLFEFSKNFSSEKVSRAYQELDQKLGSVNVYELKVQQSLEAMKSDRANELQTRIKPVLQRLADQELRAQAQAALKEFDQLVDWRIARWHLRHIEEVAQKAGLDPTRYTEPLRQKFRAILEDVVGKTAANLN